jgi:hypothetical protein
MNTDETRMKRRQFSSTASAFALVLIRVSSVFIRGSVLPDGLYRSGGLSPPSGGFSGSPGGPP